ncbi:hypothetical protein HY745_15350 [Candidatus Desantisbacteria bacterium]|nr:hypothetical protein [Candidatus Desantisbacteria bacterium]
MKNKIYLDTSIPSAYLDFSKPVRQLITQKWLEIESKNYSLYISTLTMVEINRTKKDSKKNTINNLINEYNCRQLEINEEAIELSKKYITHGAIPPKEVENSLHIAIATVNKITLLASWNFRHIVSINPIIKINQINNKFNHCSIQIGTLEIFVGSKYGKL